jgi:GrpB-like predicted nucleotidyltransferase (UPF0157 family)
MDEPIMIVNYDPQWPVRYEEERERIIAAMGDFIDDIQHIGSTAILGLSAKPIIDILVIVPSLEQVEQSVQPLEKLGYEYMGDSGIPGRHIFIKREQGLRSFHLHMSKADQYTSMQALVFRDFLRQHPRDAQEYGELKKVLAEQYGADREGYTEGKTTFIEAMLVKATLDDA